MNKTNLALILAGAGLALNLTDMVTSGKVFTAEGAPLKSINDALPPLLNPGMVLMLAGGLVYLWARFKP